jgi:hypothetical protein
MTARARSPGLATPALFHYWDAEEVPAEVRSLLDSFKRQNPDLNQHVFSRSAARGFIAARFGARERDAFDRCAIPAMQADYFRYCAAAACGGIWADADLRCRRPLRPLLEEIERGVVFLRPEFREAGGLEARRLENAFFAFREPGHPLLALAVELATANVEARIAERVWPVGENVREAIWLTTGQAIFTLMRFIYNWGSFAAFRERAAGTIVEPFCDLYCDVIGDHDRIVEAFDGVWSASQSEMRIWVANPDKPLAYKTGDRHWLNVKRAIFE